MLAFLVCTGAYSKPFDQAIFEEKVHSVAQVTVRQQVAAGIDVINDGELSKISFLASSTTNFVEHPELVAQRIAHFASLVGLERMIAGTDCGFATFAGFSTVDPDIAWAKGSVWPPSSSGKIEKSQFMKEKAKVRLTEDMKRVLNEQRLGFIASVCADGTPNLSPKGTTTVWDDEHLMFADICSPGTVANVQQRPVVEIDVVDPVARKGYRFKGPATVYKEGPIFEQALAFYRHRGTTSLIRHIVLVKVERAMPLISPAYDHGKTEDEIRGSWLRYWEALYHLNSEETRDRSSRSTQEDV